MKENQHLELITRVILLSKKIVLSMIVITSALMTNIKLRGLRYSAFFILDGGLLKCTTTESLGGYIVIHKPDNQVLTLFSLYLNYNTADQKLLSLSWPVTGEQRVSIPIFFPTVIDTSSGAVTCKVADGSGYTLALGSVPSGCSVSWIDKTHEILRGSFDPVKEFAEMFPNSVTEI